jgi:LmbE family N-acetylglucosaminyl deacetylase
MKSDVLNLYLSPHLDDAVFSCGGLIHAQRRAGEKVGVLTLCAGSPGPDAVPPLAQQYESAWGVPGEGMARRRAENAALLSGWGVLNVEFDTGDAIYRVYNSVPLYACRADLFGQPLPQDAGLLPLWEARLQNLAAQEASSVTLYAPLGVGGHVDHELARCLGQRLGEAGWRTWFYEDYPYVETVERGLEAARERFGRRAWRSHVLPIDVGAKIEGVRAYRTQLGGVFGCDKDLVRRVKSFTAETACAFSRRERLRRRLAPSGLRLRFWRRALGYHAHAERIWAWT